MTSDVKLILGVIAAVLAFVVHIPYIWGICHGKITTHLFTWVIWTLMTSIVLAAQIVSGAGPGAWSTAAVLVPCIIITILSLRYGEKNITRADWVMFLGGLAAIPVWRLTDDPLGAVVIVCCIDALAFGPTFRKSWIRPETENHHLYAINAGRHVIATAAIAQYSVVTALYPVMLVGMNALMWGMLMYRRRVARST